MIQGLETGAKAEVKAEIEFDVSKTKNYFRYLLPPLKGSLRHIICARL